jgi:hypothetical protein
MRALALGCAAALLGCAPPPTNEIPADSEVMVHRDGTRIAGPTGDPLLLRCINVDGWLAPIPYLVSDAGHALLTSPHEFRSRMDDIVGEADAAAFWEDWRDRFLTEADFERISELGFNCARLPIYYRAIAHLEGGQPVFDEASLVRIDDAVSWGQIHGVYVVLDLHSAPGGQNTHPTVSDVPSTDTMARLWEGPDAAANQAATVAIWAKLAARYEGVVAVAGYDLLNEPVVPNSVDPQVLPDLYARIIEAIRAVDQRHLVFVEGDDLAHDFSAFDAPLDDNMAYEFHVYALTGFEAWATPELRDLQPYLDLRAAHDRPLWLGEFGEQTQEWQVGVIDLAEDHDIGWALYPWKRKQTLFWNPVLRRIKSTPEWYDVADYLAQKEGGSVPVPSAAAAAAGMAQILEAIELDSCPEDVNLARAVIR